MVDLALADSGPIFIEKEGTVFRLSTKPFKLERMDAKNRFVDITGSGRDLNILESGDVISKKDALKLLASR